MTVNKVSLNDRFDLEKKIVIASGTQALVRLMLNQAVRDKIGGINSAGLVTGYRGSPLGGVDATFTKAEKFLKNNFKPFLYRLNMRCMFLSIKNKISLNLTFIICFFT